MSNGNSNRRFDVQAIKQASRGRWREIITSITGIAPEALDSNGHAGPRAECNGTDRFSAFADFDDTGGLLCRHCHNADTKPRSGDGIAAVQWLTGCTFPEALQLIAEQLGIVPEDPENDSRDILGDLCRKKQMPVESA